MPMISISLQTVNVELEKLSILLLVWLINYLSMLKNDLVFHRARIKINIKADVIMKLNIFGIIIYHKLNRVQHITYVKK